MRDAGAKVGGRLVQGSLIDSLTVQPVNATTAVNMKYHFSALLALDLAGTAAANWSDWSSDPAESTTSSKPAEATSSSSSYSVE